MHPALFRPMHNGTPLRSPGDSACRFRMGELTIPTPLSYLFVLLISASCVNGVAGTATFAFAAESGRSLTIMSYNIRVGYGRKDRGVNPGKLASRVKNLPAIVAAIESIDPDIVGLQEVLGSAQAKELAQALKMNYSFEWHRTRGSPGLWWGVALLSKYPILHSRGLHTD